MSSYFTFNSGLHVCVSHNQRASENISFSRDGLARYNFNLAAVRLSDCSCRSCVEWLAVSHLHENDHIADFALFYCDMYSAVFVSSSQVHVVYRMPASSVSMSSTVQQLNKLSTVLGSDWRSELAPKLIASDRRSGSHRRTLSLNLTLSLTLTLPHPYP